MGESMTVNNDPNMNKCYQDEKATQVEESAGSWVQALRSTFNLEAGDYVVMGSALVSNDWGQCASHYRVQLNDSVSLFPDTQIGMVNVGEWTPLSFIKKINIASGGNQNFDFDLKQSSDAETDYIKEMRVVVLKVCL